MPVSDAWLDSAESSLGTPLLQGLHPSSHRFFAVPSTKCAAEVEQTDSYNAAKWNQEARDTISRFLNTGDAIEAEKGY